MKLHETPFLTSDLLMARVKQRDFKTKDWRRHEEVTVRAQGGQVFLRQDDRIVELELVPESGAMLQYALSNTALWHLDTLKPGLVYLRVVPVQNILDECSMAFVVDVRTAESLRMLRVVDTTDVKDSIAWLQDEFLCEVPGSSSVRSFMPMRDRPDERRFQLLGRKHVLDLSKDAQGVLWVERVSTRKINTDIAWVLAEGEIRFIDHAQELGCINENSTGRLETVTSTFGTYLDLWKTYGEREWQRTVKRAASIQALAYTRCEPLSDEGGGWRLLGDPDAMRAMARRWRELSEDDDQIEIAAEAPDWNSEQYNDLAASAQPRRSPLRAKPKWRDGELLLELESPDDLPSRGYVYLSVTGDRTQQSRRIKARQFIESGRGVPGLRALLQDQPIPMVRPSRLPALTTYARASFRSGRPTDKQEEAIRVALNTPDVALIIGPPGTGKTQVIAALERRLSELNESQSIAQDVLISSFQHDAVENALERTDVYGLPAIKVGKGRDSSRSDSVDGWRKAKAEQVQQHLDALLASNPALAPLRDLGKSINDLLMLGCPPEHRAESFARVTSLVEDLGVMARIRVPSAWIDRWEEATDSTVSLRVSSLANGVDAERRKGLRRAVRAIRVTPEGAADDGRARLMNVRVRLSAIMGVLDDQDLQTLDKTCATEVLPIEMLPALVEMKSRMLDRLASDVRTHEERLQLPDALKTLLRELQDFIQEKVISTPHGRASVLERYADALASSPNSVRSAVAQYSSIVGATCQQSASRQMALLKDGREDSLDSLRFSSVIIDEAARANPMDLFVPMALARRRVVLVGDPRQLPHLLDADIEDEITAERGEQISSDIYKKSLFERLWRQFQKREASDGFSRVVMLDTQFRMHPRLGDFVSKQFYERPGLGRVKSGLLESDFMDDVPGLGRAVCSWIHVPHSKGPEERKGSSRLRGVEAIRVAEEVSRLMDTLSPEMSVGVITFYAAQRDAINEALSSPRRGITEKAETGWIIKPSMAANAVCTERLRIGTVDAFQGKEFDVVLLSTVRSNTVKLAASVDDGDESQREAFEKQASAKFGHLRSSNRLNVAMSRQRRYLLVVGDADMYRGDVAMKAVPEMCDFLELCEAESSRVS